MSGEQNGQRLEREYSGLLSALSKIYWQIFSVDLETDRYTELYASGKTNLQMEKTGPAQETCRQAVIRFAGREYQKTMEDFLDFTTLPSRLADTQSISQDFQDRDGSWWCVGYIVQARNGDGKVSQVLFTLRDVTAQKRQELHQQRKLREALEAMENARRLTELRMKTMAEAIHGGFKLCKCDPQCTFLLVSEQLAAMLGYDSPEEMIEAAGGSMADIVDHEDAVREMPTAMATAAQGQMYTMHYRIRCKDGSWKNVEDRGRLIHLAEGEDELWGFVVDQDELTQKVKALEQARQANAALEQAKKELQQARDAADAANRAKTTFLFNMSHDIRTPMNAIVGYTELLSKHQDDPEKCRDYIAKIRLSSDFLLSLINNVLEMARIESGKEQLTEVPTAKGEIFSVVTTVYAGEMRKKDIHFRSKCEIQTPCYYCDNVKVQEILMNLLSNSYKYTPVGGTITMETRELPCEIPGHIRIRTVITDTGIGMSKEYLPMLFEEFSREHDSTGNRIEGTGLGMAIVKRLVDLMGGTIEVSSEPGKGSAFTVTTTHRIARPEEAKAEKTPETGTTPTDGRILLAEDNDLNAEIVTEILKEYGFRVDRAKNGAVCVELLKQKDYDVVLMDVQMPVMDGYEATRTIRSLPQPEKRDVPILAVTANAFDEDRRNALRAGMNGHIAKPIRVEELLSAIQRVIKKV